MPSAAVERVLSKLPSAKVSGNGWNAKCPAHRDRAPSLNVHEGADGRALVRCHAGCTTEAIVSAMLLTMRDLMPDVTDTAEPFSPSRAGHTSHLRVVGNTALKTEPSDEVARGRWPETARYDYTDADGVLLFQVVRLEAPDKSGKRFLQQQPNGTWGLKGVESRPLFRLPSVLAAIARGEPVLIVEGEKDVLTAEAMGWTATTNCGGASGWKPEFARYLAGADVVVIPDHDDPGRKWALSVATSVAPIAQRVRVVALPRVPEKGDLTDWTSTGGTSDALGGLILKAPAWRAGDEIPLPPMPSRFTVYRADELIALAPTTWLVDDVLPADALGALVGPSGKGKTFLTLDLSCSLATGRRWLGHETHCAGAPVLYIAAEGTAGLRARIAAWTAEYGTPDGGLPVYFICETVNFMTPEDVDHVVRAMTALPASPSLVIVDTLHRAMPGGDENSAKDVGLVITHADRIRRAAGCTVLIVHHSKKDMDIERGSTALRAACDTLMMLRDEEGARSMTCEKQKDAADFAPHTLQFTPVHGSVIVSLAGTNGETERVADPQNLSTNERMALAALADTGLDTGLTSSDWKMASGVPDRSFFRVRASLVRGGLVRASDGRGGRYQVNPTGISALRVTATVTAKSPQNGVAVSGSNFSRDAVGLGALKGPLTRTTERVTTSRGSWHDSQTRGSDSRPNGRALSRLPSPPQWVLEEREFDPSEADR